jgi:HEAT repeat protein
MLAMIAEYMEKGFLENIIDMFKHDSGLYEKLPGLISDERSRVRIGTIALVERLMDLHREEIINSIPAISALLRHPNPLVRGDTAYLFGVIGRSEAIPYLEAAREDEVKQVRDIIEETIKELKALRS